MPDEQALPPRVSLASSSRINHSRSKPFRVRSTSTSGVGAGQSTRPTKHAGPFDSLETATQSSYTFRRIAYPPGIEPPGRSRRQNYRSEQSEQHPANHERTPDRGPCRTHGPLDLWTFGPH